VGRANASQRARHAARDAVPRGARRARSRPRVGPHLVQRVRREQALRWRRPGHARGLDHEGEAPSRPPGHRAAPGHRGRRRPPAPHAPGARRARAWRLRQDHADADGRHVAAGGRPARGVDAGAAPVPSQRLDRMAADGAARGAADAVPRAGARRLPPARSPPRRRPGGDVERRRGRARDADPGGTHLPARVDRRPRAALLPADPAPRLAQRHPRQLRRRPGDRRAPRLAGRLGVRSRRQPRLRPRAGRGPRTAPPGAARHPRHRRSVL
ncbi:MAG: ErfK/YbiS/YcfS/YnhG, partial [uncultured Nocardioides sp.]